MSRCLDIVTGDPDVVRAAEARQLHSPQEGTTIHQLASGTDRAMLPPL